MRPRAVLVTVLAAALLAVAGCGESHDESLLGPAGATTSPSGSAPARAASAPLPTTRGALLTDLARSVRTGDRGRYAALLGGDSAFRQRQLRTFDNLRRLPLSTIGFAVDGRRVQRTLGVGSYDEEPHVSPSGLRVVRSGGRPVLVDDPDHPATDPWDLATVRVARTSSTLVVTDVGDSALAPSLLGATGRAAAVVRGAVPLDWSGTAVVYAFRDPDVLAAYPRVPGGDLGHLGGLSFPVRDADGATVGHRVAVLPAALDASPDQRDRLLRHELTHVAVGDRDDDVPTWLSEGLAELVADAPLAPGQRRIATAAVDAARRGGVGLPASTGFNGADQGLHYAVAESACAVLADRGADVPWRLLDAMHAARVGRDGSAGSGQAAVLRQVTGLGPDRLAALAADRILRLYG